MAREIKAELGLTINTGSFEYFKIMVGESRKVPDDKAKEGFDLLINDLTKLLVSKRNSVLEHLNKENVVRY